MKTHVKVGKIRRDTSGGVKSFESVTLFRVHVARHGDVSVTPCSSSVDAATPTRLAARARPTYGERVAVAFQILGASYAAEVFQIGERCRGVPKDNYLRRLDYQELLFRPTTPYWLTRSTVERAAKVFQKMAHDIVLVYEIFKVSYGERAAEIFQKIKYDMCGGRGVCATPGLLGTTIPVHYTILVDEIFRASHGERAAEVLRGGVPEDKTRDVLSVQPRHDSVRICPAAYYADLVCNRAKCHKHGLYTPEQTLTQQEKTSLRGEAVHPRMKNQMYYIQYAFDRSGRSCKSRGEML
ncbi:putative Piwi_Agonaute like protein [Seiridium cardinale]|uniref:Piwi_Agonaute like protein n=1 Tax=Seiridium cardinale TaxID=138064 RepID=A0ABR2Y2X7_9PEZI